MSSRCGGVATLRRLRTNAQPSSTAAMPITHTHQRQEIDEQENRILGLLSSGVSDSAIARQVDLSQRTVERRIKALMDRLGAQSRFQMGLLARERGWI